MSFAMFSEIILNILFLTNFNVGIKSVPHYDLITVAQTWPQTACWVINAKWDQETCSPCKYVPKSKTSWTVHGLWPSRRDGNHPFYCDKTSKYDEKLLSSSLISEMKEKWFTFDLQSNNSAFWKHEWDKHGTCAKNIQSVNTIPKYFTKTLDLLDAYNIGDVLKSSGIEPRGYPPYHIHEIIHAIESHLGVRVSISCALNKIEGGASYLDQIYICFDKSLKLINCDVTTKIGSNCGNESIYPPILTPCS